MKLNLMDYSLLLGVHDVTRAEEEGNAYESEDEVIEVNLYIFFIIFKVKSLIISFLKVI